VMVKKGGNTISFNYSPSVNATEDTPTTVAYEYCFGNSMNRATAVNLKEIDTTDVTVSYAWSLNTKLDTTQSITTYTNYELQRLNNYGDEVYIYVFVTPTNETIPTTFTSSVVWYYGIPYEMPIFNNVTNEVTYQTIVDGQKIDKNTLTQPESFTKTENGTEVTYYFDAWFLDKDFTQLAPEDDRRHSQKMYARYANLPSDSLTYSDGSYSVSYGSDIPNPIIPTLYNDGINGEAKVTSIGYYAFERSSVASITLPSSLTTIETYAITECDNLTSIDLSNCTNLTTIGDYAFYYCNNLTSITLPSSVTTIGDNAFDSCYNLAEVYNLSSLDIVAGATTHGRVAYYAAIVVNGPRDESNKLVTIDGVDYYKNSETDYIALRLSDKTKTSITLDSRTTSILTYAFYWCSSLTSVDLSNCTNLTTIGDCAFCDCSSLTSVVISASVTKIGISAFYGCNYLTSLTFEEGGTWYYTDNSDYTGGIEYQYPIIAGTDYSTLFYETYPDAYWYKK
ncbi:MAG: leucine-rich repeat protein, partial [Clostridia bacterium]|nr:leucine-rich repeat protein [Clostridia bacterium]